MSSFRVASRYAKSLLQLAREKGKLEEVKNDIVLMDNAFESSAEFRALMKSPIIHSDKKQSIMDLLFKAKISALTHSFVELLLRKGRESFLHDIANSFIEQYNALNKITPVTLRTAVKLEAAAVQNIVNKLKQNEKLSEVRLTEEIDESLIGGFVLQYGDRMIDASVLRKLQQMKDVIEDDSYIKKF